MDLVLLFGMPRSGTTWIGKIFDSHPNTLYRHEPDTWRAMEGVPLAPEAETADGYCEIIGDYVRSVRGMASTRVSGKLPLFPKSYLSTPRTYLLWASITMSKLFGRYFREPPILGLPEAASAHMVWKSIESLGRLGVLLKCIPAARAIHIVRHPCGYVASVLRGEAQSRFVSKTAASEDFSLFETLTRTRVAKELGLSFDKLKRMQPHERLAWRWLVFNEKADRDLEGYERYMQVAYDDVCADPLTQSQSLFRFSGLSWTEQTEEFVKASTTTEKQSYYSVYKHPRVSAERWRQDLSATMIQEVLAIAHQGNVGRRFAS